MPHPSAWYQVLAIAVILLDGFVVGWPAVGRVRVVRAQTTHLGGAGRVQGMRMLMFGFGRTSWCRSRPVDAGSREKAKHVIVIGSNVRAKLK